MFQRPPQNSAAQNRAAYIPAGAQQVMSQHMQQAVPAHLRQYVGANAPSYIPQKAQKELTNFMQKSMPAHLQQYAGAYVQQNIVDPSLRSHTPRQAVAPPPIVDPNRRSHSGHISAEQPNAQFLNLFQADAPQVTSAQNFAPQSQGFGPQSGNQSPEQQYGAPAPNASQQPYDFIMNPQAPRRGSSPFTGGSTIKRLAVLGVGLLVLVIVGSILFSALTKPKFDSSGFISITQRQAEIVRVATLATNNASSQATLNSAFTIQLSVSSEEQQLLSYLAKNNVKVSGKTLALRKNAQTDKQLTSAAESSTYDSEFTSIMQTQLTAYQKSIESVLATHPGPTGQQLLKNSDQSATLLLTQLQTH